MPDAGPLPVVPTPPPPPREPIPQRLRYHRVDLDREPTPSEDPFAFGEDYEEDVADQLLQADADHPANLVSSLCVDGMHRPALDIDVAMEVIPSTTPGHYHLYFPETRLSWQQYQDLLRALERAGILERGYVRASEARGQTFLRLPGVRKPAHQQKKVADARRRRRRSLEMF